MKIRTEITTIEDFEVEITPGELGREIGKILSDYNYRIYHSEPTLEVNEGCDEVNIEIYRDEVDWDSIMQTKFSKDIAKALKNFSKEGESNE